MKDRRIYMHVLLIIVLAVIVAACASIGRPEGGPRDEIPPVFVKSEPAIGALNYTNEKIVLEFDENVQVKDVMDKVVVSPVQKSMPSITANGRRVYVELKDTMRQNTTYTIDFSDAISDLNEGNPLDGFAVDFSTGNEIDSLRISGMIFEARNLEPAQGMLVGVYSNLSDTAITTLPLERISKTNQLGQFTLRNLKPGTYRIFALNDLNRDYHWDRSEDIAFYDIDITPTSQPTEISDTLQAADGSDSIVVRPATIFLPNDILLTWFNEGYKSQYLKDYKRVDRRRITVDFAAPADSLPQITLLNGDLAGRTLDECALLNTGETQDTLEYWITAPELLAQDTLMVAARYMRTDTLQQLTWGTDTLKLILKENKSKDKKKDKKKKDKKKDKELIDSLLQDSIAQDSLPQLTFINVMMKTATSHDINVPLSFEISQPVDTFILDKIHFEMKRDTLWDTLALPEIKRLIPTKLMEYKIDYNWEPGATYRLSFDSAAVVGIYNEWNKGLKHEFTVKKEEEYSALYFNVSGETDNVIVELLSSSDEPVAVSKVIDGTAEFRYLKPGTYFARAFIDKNGNGEYDTGNMGDKLQPEEVYYYPKKLNLKKNWDVEQSWNLFELPLDLQKPREIKKNKPAKKRGERDTEQSEDDEDDGFYDENDPFGSGSRNNGFGGSNFNGGLKGMGGGGFQNYRGR
ncbi:MAG: Ig-like domain-containing protein [Muribaculaceae bacterium]|nr:Ig-like domain-containing protein [Muribaculaceae bacterium]